MAEDPRYVVGLQTADDRSCYKDFFETNKFEEAKTKADEAAEKNQRSTLVFDRKFGIVYKKEIVQPTDSADKPVAKLQPTRVIKKAPVEESVVKRGRGRPPKNKVENKVKEQTPNDDYF